MASTTSAVAPGTYQLDQIHSSVGFAVTHKVSKFRGGFADFEATLTVEPSGEMSLEGSAAVASIQVKNADQAIDLLSPNFFDAERFPRLEFGSSSIRVDEDGSLEVAGELTMRGHTRTVLATGTLGAVDDDGHGRRLIGIDLEAVVDRTEFGISFGQSLPGGGIAIATAVTLSAELEFVKA